jgi:hypothetical protein
VFDGEARHLPRFTGIIRRVILFGVTYGGKMGHLDEKQY